MMEYNERQKEYFINAMILNRGSNNVVDKAPLLEYIATLGIEFKKNESKEIIIKRTIEQGYLDDLMKKYGDRIQIPYWDIKNIYDLTYKQISDIEQMNILKALEYKGSRDETLYTFDNLIHEREELLKAWESKFIMDFHRTRIEVSKIEDVQELVNELSKIFEVQEVSKLYPHKNDYNNKTEYYVYLNLRALKSEGKKIEKELLGDNNNTENAQLKSSLGVQFARIRELEEELRNTYTDLKLSDEYKDIVNRLELQTKENKELNRLLIKNEMTIKTLSTQINKEKS